MRIEGDYIIFTPEETSKLNSRMAGDAWTYERAVPPRWDLLAANDHYGYTNANDGTDNKYYIRRRIAACTPEQVAEARGGAVYQHFM